VKVLNSNLEMKRKERSVSVERGSGQGLGREQRQGVDGRGDDTNDVKEIVSSSRERIMNTFGKSLEIIESKNGQLDSQDAVFICSNRTHDVTGVAAAKERSRGKVQRASGKGPALNFLALN
jgi:hypothetical protein